MTVENIDLWVSATGFESPYYRFYTDSSGSQQLSELAFDTSKSYTFYRLNGETSHPFYISDTGYKQTFSDSILITGDANPSNGITGDQSFKVEFNQLSGNIEQLLYYCSSHQLMLGNIALFDNPVPPSIPSIPDLIPASDDGTSDADNITSETTPTFIGTADADTNIELFADGNSLGTTTTDSDGDWSFSVPGSSALSDGIIAITAIASRSAGQIAVLKTNPISPSSIGRTAQEFRNTSAFAALKDDGSVITWGDPLSGGDSSSVAFSLQSGVSQIFSTSAAFAALKQDGSVITWGDDSGGGDSSSVAFQLQSGVVSFSDPFQDDQFIVETSFSNSSPALNLNVDTIAPAFISADNVTLVIDDNFAASQVVYVSKTTDSSSVSFDLKANNNDAAEFFSIDSLTGGVTLNKVPDHQGRSSYFFTVIATDSAGNVSDQIVRLEISNLEEIPIIQSIDAISAQRKVTIFKIQQPVILSGKHVDVVIVGTKKKDMITGTSSEEILAGMKRKNFLSGGDSTDGFLFNQPKGFGNKHADKITDFDSKEGDSILLDNDLFGLGKKIKFSSYGSRNKVNKAAKSKNDFVYDEKKGLLYFNENRKQKGWGDGGLFAKLHGVPELGADDFTIV
jgi:hypothetical protein